MADIATKIEAVRDAGEIAIRLLQLDRTPVSFYCETTDSSSPVLESDDRFMDTWQQITDIVSNYGDIETDTLEEGGEKPAKSVQSHRMIGNEDFGIVDVVYVADGGMTITLEFKAGDGWGTYISEHAVDLTVLDVGRRIAAIEIAVLANELESPAETLDYWMTTEQYSRQSTWADVRQASRQTVSDRVRLAKEKLETDTASN